MIHFLKALNLSWKADYAHLCALQKLRNTDLFKIMVLDEIPVCLSPKTVLFSPFIHVFMTDNKSCAGMLLDIFLE